MNKTNIKNILKYIHTNNYQISLNKLRDWYNSRIESDKLYLIIGAELSEEHVFMFLLKNLDKRFELISHCCKDKTYDSINKKIEFSDLYKYKENLIDEIYFDYNVIKHFVDNNNPVDSVFYFALTNLKLNGSLYIPFESITIEKLQKLSIYARKLLSIERRLVKFDQTDLLVYKIYLYKKDLYEKDISRISFYEYNTADTLNVINNGMNITNHELFKTSTELYFTYFKVNNDIMELNFNAIKLALKLILRRAFLAYEIKIPVDILVNISHEIIDNGLYRKKSQSSIFNYNKYPYNVWFKITKLS